MSRAGAPLGDGCDAAMLWTEKQLQGGPEKACPRKGRRLPALAKKAGANLPAPAEDEARAKPSRIETVAYDEAADDEPLDAPRVLRWKLGLASGWPAPRPVPSRPSRRQERA